MSDTVLYGGISNTVYIWQSSGEACEKCSALDGQIFNSLEDVPDRPHPNCQCTINEQETDDGEECDVVEQIDTMLDEVEEVSGEIESLYEEAENDISFIENALSYPVCQSIIDFGESILNLFSQANQAWEIFNTNKAEMEALADEEKFEHFDKYYHAKANCESAKLGKIGEFTAYVLSILKECRDLYVKVILEKKNFEETWNDCMQDLRADKYGICQGHEDGDCQESVRNVVDIIKGRVEKNKKFE